ncbi:PIG-L deacetylase family protein [Bacillus sp. Cs-700]|uniref:PIG-L deacetylase family protein n=1 Tax=Bacillus sp. Cs-700 TaxID=2589818 RepID=UPI00140A8AF2|nr:PIG-L deacetylase family protein [Bacillus sp. Cs-700]
MLSTLKRSLKPLLLKTYNSRNNKFSKDFINSNRERIVERNQLVTSLPGEKILVLAPHVDDDMIGCGGAILKYLKEGKEVHIAYLTQSNKRGSIGLQGEEIIIERKKEAETVAKKIGLPLNQLHFLSACDSELLTTDLAVELGSIMSRLNPDVVFFPSIIDTHTDHYAVSKKLYELAKEQNGVLDHVHLMMYEVQNPISPVYSNRILDITEVYNEKVSLLHYYKSQQTRFYFLPIMNHLNGLVFGEGKKAEVYIETNIQDYLNFVEKHFEDNEYYFQLKPQLIGHRDHRNTIPTYKNILESKKVLRELI